MEVLKERDMKLLSRKRVVLMIDTEGSTPSRISLIADIAKKYKVKEDLVVIKHIYPQFGQNKTKLIVNIYQDADKMKLFEHEDLLKKHKGEPVTKEVEEKPPKPEQQDKAEDAAEAEEPKEKELAEEKVEAPVDAPSEEKPPVEEAPKEAPEDPVAENVEEPAEESAKEE